MNDQEQMLADMWAAGASAEQIGRRIGIARDAVYQWIKRLELPKRPRKSQPCTPDPTPDEIAQRAREMREAHFAKRRGETRTQTDTRLSKERERERLRA